MMKSYLLLSFPALTSSFVLIPNNEQLVPTFPVRVQTFLPSSFELNNEEPENDGLLLSGLDQEMSKVASKYSFSESDFLAAARKRAEMRMESSNGGATDEEWQNIAKEKKNQYGEIDDWENSAKEAGNSDSQILMFTESTTDNGDEGSNDDEPELLLF